MLPESNGRLTESGRLGRRRHRGVCQPQPVGRQDAGATRRRAGKERAEQAYRIRPEEAVGGRAEETFSYDKGMGSEGNVG